jgi:hypothetical protein
MKKRIPKFNSEDGERDFWATHDSAKYVVWKKAKRIRLPEWKPSNKTISVRLPESMLNKQGIVDSDQAIAWTDRRESPLTHARTMPK